MRGLLLFWRGGGESPHGHIYYKLFIEENDHQRAIQKEMIVGGDLYL